MPTHEPNWSQVVDELGPKLYRYFSGSFAPAAAADLVQDTLVRLLQKQRNGAWDPAKGTLATFAFGIARYVRLEAQKGFAGLEMLTDENADVPSSLPAAHDSDPAAHLRWAIRQLGLIEQEILLRLIDEECQLEEIANELGLPLGTVKSHIHRAKEKLRALMEVNV